MHGGVLFWFSFAKRVGRNLSRDATSIWRVLLCCVLVLIYVYLLYSCCGGRRPPVDGMIPVEWDTRQGFTSHAGHEWKPIATFPF